MRQLRPLTLVLLLVLLAACGGGGSEVVRGTTAATGERESAAAPGAEVRVGLVTDAGGVADRSLNALASRGLEQAEKELGVSGRVVVSRSSADYATHLTTLADEGYDLVVGVGRPLAGAVEAVAGRFPRTSFAVVDGSQAAMASRPPNVRGLLFAEEEAGYLVGYLAGLVAAETGGANPTVSSVGGRKVPAVDRYLAGFRAGARAAAPGIQTLNEYSEDVVDQARCKEIALNQISRGSKVVFPVAGRCGLGALDAADEQNVDGIGVDADQSQLGDHILTSALKRVDVAVFQTVQELVEGTFAGGRDATFDLASGGVGIGRVSADVPGEIVARVNEIQQRIASGRLGRIPTRVRD